MVRTGGAGKPYAVNQDLSVRHARPADIIHSNLALTPGTRLGVYDVIAPIGEGGMGQVYRATDTTLGRQVAIKILPDAFASDPDRMARFEREAKTLGSLNHPHIAAIYGFEKSAAMHALVMELVEGEDLAQRIARGAIPLDEALPVAKQIADALEAAHEKGIIHRDLKPTNIKIRPDGTVKVLDFGLAKAVDPAGTSSVDAMHSPTLTARATQMGMIIGTAAYMAPEQAKGKSVDQRADIWAFGVVLYEMLTGRRAFQGDDISEVLASVLKTDPDLSVVPADVSPSVHRLLRRCLEKDPRRRLSAIGDARLELDEIEPAAPAVRATAAPARRSIVARVWPAVAGIVITAAVAAWLWPSSRQTTDTGVTRLSVVAPSSVDIYPDSAEVAISPDGRMVAFVVGNSVTLSTSQLWIRSLDAIAARRFGGWRRRPSAVLVARQPPPGLRRRRQDQNAVGDGRPRRRDLQRDELSRRRVECRRHHRLRPRRQRAAVSCAGQRRADASDQARRRAQGIRTPLSDLSA